MIVLLEDQKGWDPRNGEAAKRALSSGFLPKGQGKARHGRIRAIASAST
jgi:hypothetical protein